MLEVYDRAMRKRAVLENAFDVTEEAKINAVGTLKFSLPGDDPKNAHCEPFAFVRSNAGVFYRILLPERRTRDTDVRSYMAEHCIATLVDDVMFRSHVIGGVDVSTRDVIEYILGFQGVQRWKLGACDFSKQFEYGLESENLLNALFSVPNLFVEDYIWAYDFTTYPWTVSLKRLDKGAKPQFYIRAGKNLIESTGARDGAEVCTRLYLLGFGEGDNQLGIEAVNGGLPYIQSPQAYIDKYGLISKVYVDRSFEDAESLLARGRSVLEACQDPPYSRTFSVADLYEITGQRYDHAQVGDLVRLSEDDTTTYITAVSRNLDRPGDMKIELSTRPVDLVASVADIAARQRIEQVYAQGATQIYAQSVQANADTSTPAVLSFYIPERMKIINKVEAKIRIDPFRSYCRMTSGGGGSATTSGDGSGSTQTSRSSGAATYTSESGGGATRTTSMSMQYTDTTTVSATQGSSALNTGSGSGGTGTTGAHSHTVTGSTTTYTGDHSHPGVPHTHPMDHYHLMPHVHGMYHAHSIDIPAHQHSVSIGNHQHSVDIPSHAHTVEIPSHSHDIVQGIFRFGNPTGGNIEINGAFRLAMERDGTFDLTPYLLRDDGKIPRDTWIQLGVRPNDLAYITIDIFVQGFVQSRGGGTH